MPAKRRVGGAQVGAILLQEPQHHAAPIADGRMRQRRATGAVDGSHGGACVAADSTQSAHADSAARPEDATVGCTLGSEPYAYGLHAQRIDFSTVIRAVPRSFAS